MNKDYIKFTNLTIQALSQIEKTIQSLSFYNKTYEFIATIRFDDMMNIGLSITDIECNQSDNKRLVEYIKFLINKQIYLQKIRRIKQ